MGYHSDLRGTCQAFIASARLRTFGPGSIG